MYCWSRPFTVCVTSDPPVLRVVLCGFGSVLLLAVPFWPLCQSDLWCALIYRSYRWFTIIYWLIVWTWNVYPDFKPALHRLMRSYGIKRYLETAELRRQIIYWFAFDSSVRNRHYEPCRLRF